MTPKEALKHMCRNCESKSKYTKILCPFRSISNEYCPEYDDISKKLVLLEILKVVCKHIFIGVDIVNKEECFGTIIIEINNVSYQIYGTHDYEEVLKLKKIKEWLEND